MDGTGSRGLTLARGSGQRLLGNYDLRVILQLVKTTVGYNVSRVDAGHRRVATVGDAGLDVANLGRVILNDIDECSLAIMLDGRRRNYRDTLQSVYQQPRIHELVGEEGIVFVVEERPHLNRASGGVDLVVEGEELASAELGLLRAIESIHGEPLSMLRLRLHLCEAVFRDGKNHSDRLQLSDHGERRSATRLDDVARIYQP